MKKLPNYQTYLINLDRAKDRLNLMEYELDKAQVSYERISAIDASKLNSEEYTIRNKYDRELVSGEIGCYLSHVKTMKTFLHSEFDFALIIEDDAILVDNFKSILENSIITYNELPKKHQWDVLKLFNGKRKHIKITDIDNSYLIGACGTSIPITTIAAVWTRKAAEKFLAKINSEKPIICRPIDCDLQHPWEFDLRIYNLLPSLVQPAPVETQIQLEQHLKKAKLFKQIKYELNRIFPKYIYYISHHGTKEFYTSFIERKNKKFS